MTKKQKMENKPLLHFYTLNTKDGSIVADFKHCSVSGAPLFGRKVNLKYSGNLHPDGAPTAVCEHIVQRGRH